MTTEAEDLVGALEALLFTASRALCTRELADLLHLQPPLVEQALQQLQARLDRTRGLQLRRVDGGYQLVTRREHAEVVARLLAPRRASLSAAALEVLAVVAYQQPVTRAEIEAVRGVQSGRALRTLLDFRLIEEVGRKEAPGRPILYGTTRKFLEMFGLFDLRDLPPLESLYDED